MKNENQIIDNFFRVTIDCYFEFLIFSFIFYFHKELKNEVLKQIKINFMIIFTSMVYTLLLSMVTHMMYFNIYITGCYFHTSFILKDIYKQKQSLCGVPLKSLQML